MKLHEDDLKAVLSLAKQTLSMFDEKQALTDYLGAKIAEIAPILQFFLEIYLPRV